MRETDLGSLSKKVFRELENAIINREYVEGDSLNELRISEKLGVSRTPIREALMQLEYEGLVRIVPNKGAVVVGVSEQDVFDIYAIRLMTEGTAAKLFAENATDEQKRELKDCVDLQDFYLIKGDTKRIWALDSDFHELLYSGCGNRILGSMLRNYHNCIKRARDISVSASGRAEKSVAEHRAICNAICEGDGKKAEKLVTDHLKNAQQNFLSEASRARETRKN